MATKKELEDRIAALEVEVALLRAQRPIQVLPRPADVPWPRDWYWPPQAWCGTGTVVGVKNTFAVNAAS